VDSDVIRALWEAGETDRAARAIYDALPDRLRPGWAADILELVCSRLPAVPEPVRAVVAIGRDPRRFRAAHAAFSAVRILTLAEDRSGAGGAEYAAVLGLAEDAAKVIYNASGVREPIRPGEKAPFDDECGYYLAGGLCFLARTCGAPDFGRAAWAVQEAWLRRATGASGPPPGGR
jgi:hypothetical protein